MMTVKKTKTRNKTQKLLLGVIAGAMTLQLTGCGDLKGLINSPAVQSSIQSFLDLYLGREVDGQAQNVQPGEIKAIRADGKPVSFEVGAEGKVAFKDLPADAQQLEIEYDQVSEPVVMPIQADQKQDGRMIMRGMTRMEKGENGRLKVDAHYAGFDYDRDGDFDAQRPQFVHQDRFLSVHDAQHQQVRRFEANGQGAVHFDFNQPPKQVLEGEGFFLPPRPLMVKLAAGQRPACGPLQPKPDGSIDLPHPDGTPRNLKTGEFELKPEARAVKVLKAGEPDLGKVVFMPCRPMLQPGPGGKPLMPRQPGQPGQPPMPGQPGNPPAPQSPAPAGLNLSLGAEAEGDL